MVQPRSLEQLRLDAWGIWQAGLEAVRSERLVEQALRVEGEMLVVGSERIALRSIRRMVVVGAGKAGAGMAAAVEDIFGPKLMEEKDLVGWVNVPEDCVRPLRRIHLHGARPAGVNEPTQAGVRGAEEILRLVGSLGSEDLCFCLISGGGSALLPAPIEGITLADKLAVTRFLSAAGATIEQMNIVRKQLSRVKGGGLARACRAGQLVSLIISDVLGDPLDVIASGPTVPDSSTPQAALDVLEQFHATESAISSRVWEVLQQRARQAAFEASPAVGSGSGVSFQTPLGCRVRNLVIGNNAMAVKAAADEARCRGYCPQAESATRSEGLAEEVGIQLAHRAFQMRRGPGPDGLISGGEPVVRLVEPARRGRGGRNQQLVLAALEVLASADPTGIVLLSGGTDGEDGPTDAAGAWVDAEVIRSAQARGLDPADFLARNDAYRFFEPLGALIRTGPTHTNVCDLRVVLVDRQALASGETPS